jgi:translation initiation factor IF-2
MLHNASRLGRLSSSCLSSLNPDSEGPLKFELSWAWPGGSPSHLAEATAARASAHWGRAATAPGRATSMRWQWPAPGFQVAWRPVARALASASARPWHAAPACGNSVPVTARMPDPTSGSAFAGPRVSAAARRAGDLPVTASAPCPRRRGQADSRPGPPGPGARRPGPGARARGPEPGPGARSPGPGPGARAPGTPSHWHPRARTLRLKFKIFESGSQRLRTEPQ